MRIIKPILLFSLLANLTSSFMLIKFFLEKNNLYIRKPELIVKIDNSTIAKDKIEFEKIVKEKFKFGFSEQELIRELSRQGFIPGWSYENKPKTAYFVRSTIACNSIWSIMWESDKFGNVNKISGRYSAGCL